MTHSSLHFQVEQLRIKNLTKTLETVAVFLLSLVVMAILPSLLLRYVYAGQQLFEQPKALEYIPVASFIVAVAFFIFAMVGNLMREMKARQLEKEALLMDDTPRTSLATNSMAAALSDARTSVRPARRKPVTRRN